MVGSKIVSPRRNLGYGVKEMSRGRTAARGKEKAGGETPDALSQAARIFARR